MLLECFLTTIYQRYLGLIHERRKTSSNNVIELPFEGEWFYYHIRKLEEHHETFQKP